MMEAAFSGPADMISIDPKAMRLFVPFVRGWASPFMIILFIIISFPSDWVDGLIEFFYNPAALHITNELQFSGSAFKCSNDMFVSDL